MPEHFPARPSSTSISVAAAMEAAAPPGDAALSALEQSYAAGAGASLDSCRASWSRVSNGVTPEYCKPCSLRGSICSILILCWAALAVSESCEDNCSGCLLSPAEPAGAYDSSGGALLLVPFALTRMHASCLHVASVHLASPFRSQNVQGSRHDALSSRISKTSQTKLRV